MVRGLFIGRFQPFHNAHLEDIRYALRHCDDLIIGVGSSNKDHTAENPFNIEERIRMIEHVLDAEDIIPKCTIFPVPDITEHSEWVRHVISLVPKFDVIFTGNAFTEKLFTEAKIKVHTLKLIKEISSTRVRELIREEGNWQSMVPGPVVAYLEDNKLVDRVKSL